MPKKTKIIFITTFIILAIFFSFHNETLAVISFKIIPVITKDSVSITINCPSCVQQTPGYIKITNTSGSVGNGQKSFTSLKDTLVFNGLQLGSTYNVQAVATDSKKPFYSDPNDIATVSSSFKVPLNLDPNSPTIGNTTPLKVDIVKSGTTATISVTCNNQCNGLRGSATVTGDNYNKTSPTEKNLVMGIPTKYTFDGLEAGKTYSVSGKPYLPSGIIYTWGTSFTMDAVNNGPITVNADIPTDTPVAITGIPSPANFGIYNLLAPIGNFKQLTSSDNIGTYFNTIFLIAIGLCGVLAVIMFIIGGIQYMGDESIFGKTKGKEQMESAILGLLIALGSYALLNTINPDLLGGKGVNITQVSAQIDLEDEIVPWSEYQKGDDIKNCPEGFTDVTINTGAAPAVINVCKSIAGHLMDLVTAAKNDGVILSGSGSRSMSRQQQLRVKNGCPDPASPSSACFPKTARPGHSNHERGLAIDFHYCSVNGIKKNFTKTDRTNPCYVWLTKNAGRFGFKNNYALIVETWHWSTTGT